MPTTADLFADPTADPAIYPGNAPATSCLLAGGRTLLALEAGPGGHLDEAAVEVGGSRVPLQAVLRRHHAAPMEQRVPVLAVGSNAAPGQLAGKLARANAGPVVPMTVGRVRGLGLSHSAHVSRPGYVPVAPVPDPGAVRRFVVLWLDRAQLRCLDATEAGYDRCRLDARVAPVDVPATGGGAGWRLPGCTLYAGRHGVLREPGGAPVADQPQARLLAMLLRRSARLRRLAGPDPAAFHARTAADARLRERVGELFREEGWVGRPAVPVVTAAR